MEGGAMKIVIALVLLLTSAYPVAAQWAVADAANLVQNTTTALNSVKQVYNSGQQLLTEWNILRQNIIQIENQVRNLQRIPAGLNLLDVVGAYGARIDSLLSQANAVSFTLGQAERDFDRLYRVSGAVTGSQALAQCQQ